MHVLVLVGAIVLAGCAAPSTDRAEVLATFYPLEFVAQRIAAESLTVATLVPAGVEPHDWEPSAPDVARLGQARIVLAQGGGFEPWLDGLVSNVGERAPRVVVTTSTIQLAAHEDGEGASDEAHEGESELDPHTWIAPRLFARQAQLVEDALASTWPEHADAFRANGDALRTELATLDGEYVSGLATCEARVIIANHDAYNYLASAYDFDVVALSGLSPESEPDPETIARAIEVARGHNITIVFFEELVSPRVAEVVATEVQAESRVLSPIEGRPENGDYVSIMRENLVNLREAMRCT